MKTFWIMLATATTITVLAEEDIKPATAPQAMPTAPKTISVQEMIETGPPQMRLHALAMITQGRVALDNSYLKTFEICLADKNQPIRSVAARILGTNWIKEGTEENPDAINLLLKFSHDDAEDVRFSAVYHGLANIQKKSDEVLKRLIEIAETDRDPTLNTRITEGLANHKDAVKAILDKQLADSDADQAIRAFEIYEDLTGEMPADSERFLNTPSSRPVLFIFSADADDPEKARTDLTRALEKTGIKNPDISFSGQKKEVLLVKTYMTGDRLLIRKHFTNHTDFPLTQQLWLSPKLEAQMEAMKAK